MVDDGTKPPALGKQLLDYFENRPKSIAVYRKDGKEWQQDRHP
jgi:hypothetical protein